MLWDDHGVRNDWGSLPQDSDPLSLGISITTAILFIFHFVIIFQF
jgi:hypothetical protein